MSARRSFSLLLLIGSMFIGPCLQGMAYGEGKKAAGSVLSELLSRGLDPRWSRIFPDTLAAKATLSPIIRELPPPAGPREVRLSGRRAIVSPNIRMHPSSITTQSEMTVVTHPLNPDVVLAGANAVHVSVSVGSQGWYHTTDGGASWGGEDTLPTHSDLGLLMADPAVGIDLDGNLFFNALLYGGTSDVIVARSTDNGTSWSQTAVPRDTGGFRDKNHFAADLNPGNPYENYLYTAYTDFGPVPSPVMFSHSSDRGVSFSTPVSISGGIGSEFAQGINLSVGPNSELYAAWSGYDAFPPVTTHLGFNKSTDGGATWQGAVSLRDVFDIRGQINKGGNFVRVNSFPSMAVDRSGGSRDGWIYIVYAEKNPTTPDIFLVRSTDGGSTWSAPHKVNQDVSGKDQWFSWASVDPATGHLYVVYYDSRNFSANDSAQVYISSSTDGGDTFEDVLVSDVAFLPAPIPGLAGGYMGDYIGISARNGVVWPCWNDNRTGIHQGYTSRIVFLEVGSPPKISVSPDTLDFETVFLGYPETLSVSVRNLGFPETLQVSNIVSDNPVFTPEITDFVLPGGAARKVKVALNPSGVGLVTGSLTITSSDTANPTVTITLKGEGLVAPDISVSPDSFKIDLFTGDVAVETLTIANIGGSDLNFDISIGEQTALALQARPLRLQPAEKNQPPAYKPLKNWQDFRETARENRRVTSDARAATLAPPLPIVITDPAGDGGVVDITLLRGSGGSGQLQIQMELSTTIVPTNFGGFLSLDIDQNRATGVPPSFGNPNQDIGVEYEFTFFSLGSGIVNLYNAVTGTFVGSYPVVIGANTITFSAPLTDLGGDDGKMDITGVIGDAFGPTDWFPNSGHGTIGALDFLAVSPESGTVPAGFSLDVEVTFDATGIPGGHFFANLFVSSNDPDEKVDTIPTHLHVIGAPNIVLSDDTLDFGDAFVGYPDTLILTVFNNGTDLLEVTGMTIDNSRFSLQDATVFNVPPGDSQNVRVQFLPIAVGPDSGVLSIASTDSTDSIVTVQLVGNGILPPNIAVSPDSLADSLFTGETVVETLTVANSGYSDLNFDVAVEATGTAAISMSFPTSTSIQNSTDISLAVKTAFIVTDFPSAEAAHPVDNAEAGFTFKPEFAKRVYKLPLTPPGLANILVMEEIPASFHYDAALNNLGLPRTLVTNWPGLESELAGGTSWDLVIVNSYGNFPPPSVLDMLNSYQSSGGRLIYADWALFDYPLHPLLANLGISFVSDFTTPINFHAVNTGHPVFNIPNDVSNFSWTDDQGFRDGEIVNVLVGASQLAAFDGFPASGAVVLNAGENCLFNAFQSVNFNADGDLDGKVDIVELIENEITLLGGTQFLTTTPTSGTIPAGSSMDIEVTFDATGLNGGDYFANLLISSNDPDESVDTTSAHLHVTGAPDIAVSDTLLDYDSVFTVASRAETLVVSNEGTDLLTVSDIFSDNPVFTAGVDSFSLAPGGSQNVLVTFTPGDTGLFTGQLTLVSNDPDEPSVAVLLQGVGIYPPVMNVSPDTFAFTLLEGDSATATLTIRNTGLGNLSFTFTNDFSPASLRTARLSPPSAVGNEKIVNPYGTAVGRKTQYTFPVRLGPQAGSLIPLIPASSGQRLFGAGGGGISEIDLSTGTVLNSYPTPVPTSDGPTALAFSGSKLYFTDAFTTFQIYVLNPNSGSVLDSFPAPSPFIDGLAFVNGKLYAQDYDASLLYELTADSGHLLRAISPPVIIGGGLDGGSGRLFASNFSSAIYELSPVDGSVLNSFAPVTTVYGLGFTGRRLFATVPGVGIDEYDPNTGTYRGRISTLGFAALAGGGVDWLSEVPTGGTVAPGESLEVQVTVRTDQLDGGFFRANILVSGNDPVNPEDTVPVSLRVIGVPNIVLSDDTLDFGDVFINYPDTLTLTVSNNGSDFLEVTGITSDNPRFLLLDPPVFNVPPGDSRDIRVQFLPTQTGSESGHLYFTNTDSVPPVDSIVALVGNGIYPPAMEVSPDSFVFSLIQGDSTTAAMTIANTGLGELVFEVNTEFIPSSLIAAKTINGRKPNEDKAETSPAVSEKPVQILRLEDSQVRFVNGISADGRDPGPSGRVSFKEKSRSALTVGDTILINFDNLPQPCAFIQTVALSTEYSAFGVTFQGPSANDGGGILDQCGGFGVLGHSPPNFLAFNSSAPFFDGGIPRGPETILFTPSVSLVQVSAGSNAGQPLMMEAFDADGNRIGADTVILNPSLQPLRVIVDGIARVVISSPASVFVLDDLRFVQASWLVLNPLSGTVQPGGNIDVEVKIRTNQLGGGEFRANILVSNNNPAHPRDTVPVSLTVRSCAALKGDLNGDTLLTSADVVLELNCVFLNEGNGTVGGNCNLCYADLDCNGQLTPGDVVLELLAVFLYRPFPCL